MYYLILKKNHKKKYSYNLLLYNNHKQIKKKIGVVAYNSGVKKFVLTVDLLLLVELMRKGVYFSLDFYKLLNKIVNTTKVL